MSSPAVLVVAPPGAAVPDVVGPLADAGFVTHRFGDPQSPVPAALVVLADAVDDPIPFTRRLRASEPVAPILWLLSKDTVHLAPAGLDAGADACLLRPANGPLLVAQLRSLLRARTVTATADELRELTGRLQRLYEQTEQDAELAKRLAGLLPNAVPASADWRYGVACGGGLDAVPRVGGPAVILIDVAGLGTVGGAVAAGGITRALARELADRDPAAALTAVNGALRTVGLPESAVVSATVAAFDAESGRARVATAGFPAPVLVRPDAPAEVWVGSGLFLGAGETEYAEMVADLAPGEKLILLGRGAADRRPDVREIADAHRHLGAQPLADALAAELGADAAVALVVAERVGS